MMNETENEIKKYNGNIPSCAVFCGGCSIYTRKKNPCLGAEINCERCEKCKTFHLCCKDRNIFYCHECDIFPCSKFKSFSKRWLKYGQNFVENQKLLKKIGKEEFLKYFNLKVENKEN